MWLTLKAETQVPTSGQEAMLALATPEGANIDISTTESSCSQPE